MIVLYGEVLSSNVNIPKGTRFWMEKDLTSNPFSSVDLRPGDVVMDIGACVGTFGVAALAQGASKVTAYEPEPRNLALTRENLAPFGDRAEVVGAALVGPAVIKEVRLILSGFTGAHSTVRGNGKRSIIVPARRFRSELLRVRPDVLKVDVESAEYGLFDSLKAGDLSSVRSLFIEFHPIEDREQRVSRVREFVRDEGLSEVSAKLRRYVANREHR